MPKSSEARKLEHADSKLNPILFDGTLDTLPYRSGDSYDGREVLSIGITSTLYGNQYHLIVAGDDTHAKTRFVFDKKHDLVFTKPLEKMSPRNLRELNVPNLDT